MRGYGRAGYGRRAYAGQSPANPAAVASNFLGTASVSLTISALAGLGITDFYGSASVTTNAVVTVKVSFSGSASVAMNARITAKALLFGSASFATGNLVKMQAIEAVFNSSSSVRVFVPFPRTISPALGREPYRLVVVDMFGNRFEELENAKIGSVIWALNDIGSIDFTLPTNDPKALACKAPQREVQCWRGSQLIWWGVLLKGRATAQQISFQASTLEWYFTARVIGSVPIPNRILNGGFEQDESFWGFGFTPGSNPAAPPGHRMELIQPVLSGTKALYLKGTSGTTVVQEGSARTDTLSGDVNFAVDSSTLTAAGQTNLTNIINQTQGTSPTITVVGHADSTGSAAYNQSLSERRAESAKTHMLSVKPAAQIRAYGAGETQPVATNATSEGRTLNRRVTVTYSIVVVTEAILAPAGHKQYAYQTYVFNNPTSQARVVNAIVVAWVYIHTYVAGAANNYGLWIGRFRGGQELSFTNVPISEETPIGRWVRMETALEIPPDGVDEVIEVRLYPPDGETTWDEVSLTFSDALVFTAIDQAAIIEGLTIHSQQAVGKTDLAIGYNCPRTGVTRTRIYPYEERQQIIESLYEFPKLANGMDVSIVYTPTTRTMTSYYPRKGSNNGIVLALGANIQDFSLDVDGEQTATTVIVQAEGEGSDREEGWAMDTSLTGGVVLEKVYNATPGSSVSSLQAQADRGLKRYRRSIQIPSITTTPDALDSLLYAVNEGDVVTVDIRKGWVNLYGLYRITTKALNPNTDQITYTITPED